MNNINNKDPSSNYRSYYGRNSQTDTSAARHTSARDSSSAESAVRLSGSPGSDSRFRAPHIRNSFLSSCSPKEAVFVLMATQFWTLLSRDFYGLSDLRTWILKGRPRVIRRLAGTAGPGGAPPPLRSLDPGNRTPSLFTYSDIRLSGRPGSLFAPKTALPTMANHENIVGTIRVPLSAFTYQPGKGRGKDVAVVRRLSYLFETDCRPDEWEHHIKGEIDATTFSRILLALGLSEAEFRKTAQTGNYPRLRIRKSILCLDGRQRIAAARKQFGKNFWWPVKLYRGPAVSIFSRQTQYSDGDICWQIFCFELGETDSAESWWWELSESKQKILRLLLRREEGQLKHKGIVEALHSVLRIPGMRRGFKLGCMAKCIAGCCPENVVRYLSHIVSQFVEKIAGGDWSLALHMDAESICLLEGLNPSNSVDRRSIRCRLDADLIFPDIKSAPVREMIRRNILSLDVILPSLKTFHENMIYFLTGVKILKKFIVDESTDKSEGNGNETLFQSLSRCWTQPSKPLIEASEGVFQPLVSSDSELAYRLLFLDALRGFPHLSNEPLLQDKRGEPSPTACEDTWYIFQLRARARRHGFHTKNLSRGLAMASPPPRAMEWDLDWDVRAKNWRGGKPSTRNFLELQRDAFMPILQQADGRREVTASFVQKDFMEAFFGPCFYMTDEPEMEGNWSPPPEERMQVDNEAPATGDAPPHATQDNETLTSQHAGQASSLVQELSRNPHSSSTSRGHSKTSYKPPRRRASNSRSKSPSSRIPTRSSRSPIRRDRRAAGQPRSPVSPPRPTSPAAKARLWRQSQALRLAEMPETQNESHNGQASQSQKVSDRILQNSTQLQTTGNTPRALDNKRDSRLKLSRRQGSRKRSESPPFPRHDYRSRQEQSRVGNPRSIIIPPRPTSLPDFPAAGPVSSYATSQFSETQKSQDTSIHPSLDTQVQEPRYIPKKGAIEQLQTEKKRGKTKKSGRKSVQQKRKSLKLYLKPSRQTGSLKKKPSKRSPVWPPNIVTPIPISPESKLATPKSSRGSHPHSPKTPTQASYRPGTSTDECAADQMQVVLARNPIPPYNFRGRPVLRKRDSSTRPVSEKEDNSTGNRSSEPRSSISRKRRKRSPVPLPQLLTRESSPSRHEALLTIRRSPIQPPLDQIQQSQPNDKSSSQQAHELGQQERPTMLHQTPQNFILELSPSPTASSDGLDRWESRAAVSSTLRATTSTRAGFPAPKQSEISLNSFQEPNLVPSPLQAEGSPSMPAEGEQPMKQKDRKGKGKADQNAREEEDTDKRGTSTKRTFIVDAADAFILSHSAQGLRGLRLRPPIQHSTSSKTMKPDIPGHEERIEERRPKRSSAHPRTYTVPSTSSDEESYNEGQPIQSQILTPSTYRVPSSSDEGSAIEGQLRRSPIYPPGAYPRSSEESLTGGQRRRSPIPSPPRVHCEPNLDGFSQSRPADYWSGSAYMEDE